MSGNVAAGTTKRAVLLVAPLMLLAIAGGSYAAGGGTDSSTVVPFLGLTLAAGTVGIWRGIRRQQQSQRSMCIEVTDDALAREQDGHPRFEIPLAEITVIAEVPGKGLLVRGRGPERALFLPRALARFDELRARLAAVRPIEPGQLQTGYVRIVAVSVGMIVALVVVWRAQSPILVLATGTMVMLALGGCAFAIARSPHVDRRTKRGVWALLLVAFSIAASMWHAWQRL